MGRPVGQRNGDMENRMTEEERILRAQKEIDDVLTKYRLEFAWDELADGEMVIVLQSDPGDMIMETVTLQ